MKNRMEKVRDFLLAYCPSVFFALRAINRFRLAVKKKIQFLRFREECFVFVSSIGYAFHILIDPKNEAIDEYIYLHRSWEPEMGIALSKYLTPGGVFLDVGANIGYHTLTAASLVGKEGKVFSFEPIKSLASQLERSITKNEFFWVTIFNSGCGQQHERKTIFYRDDNMGGSSVVPVIPSQFHQKRSEEIELNAIDSYNFARVDVMKVDVEGYEYEVFKGAERLLRQQKPIVIFEYSPLFYNAIDSKISYEILKFLEEIGYSFCDLHFSVDAMNADAAFKAFANQRQIDLICIPTI